MYTMMITKDEIKLLCKQEAVKIQMIILKCVQIHAGDYLLEEL